MEIFHRSLLLSRRRRMRSLAHRAAEGVRYFFMGDKELDSWITSKAPGSAFSIIFPIPGIILFIVGVISAFMLSKSKIVRVVFAVFFIAIFLVWAWQNSINEDIFEKSNFLSISKATIGGSGLSDFVMADQK